MGKFDWNEFLAKGGAFKSAGALALIVGIGFIIRKVIKANAKPETLKNGADDPSTYFQNQGIAGSMGIPDIQEDPNASNKYTIVDSNTGDFNNTGKDLEKTLEDELFATFYTSDSAVLGALEQLKTTGDLAFLIHWWNNVVVPVRGPDKGLMVMLQKEMSSGNYDKALKYLNSLPQSI
ncbi:MAG: hypothetical protein KGJ07_03715 [Patescibacteria group bacterium]|nr:hypothetical protein [Patescibacteria group bacterium]